MIAIKDKEMPKYCWGYDIESKKWKECPIYKACKHHTSNIEIMPSDCPLVEIGTCKDCKYVSQNDANDRYCGLSGGYYDPNYYCRDFEKRGSEK